jgi:hypothetical protein
MDIDEFVARWGIDEGSQTTLLQLDPDTQATVIRGFAPKAHTQNVDKLFAGYVRSLQSGAAPSRTVPSPIAAAPVEVTFEDSAACEAFCTDWGLDQTCVDALLALAPDERSEVTSRFAPKPGTRNLVGLFHSFCGSIGQGAKAAAKGNVNGGNVKGGWAPSHAPAQPRKGKGGASGGFANNFAVDNALAQEVVLFCEHWGLDSACSSQLQSQPHSMQRQVMASFVPKAGTRNVNSLFMSFLRSLTQTAVAPASWGGGQQALAWSAPPARRADGPSWGNSAGNDVVSTFARSWGLDEECIASLRSCTPRTQREVMASFQPKESTRNVSGLFMGFVRSIAQRVEGSPAAYPASQPGPYDSGGDWTSGGLANEDTQAEVAAFLQHWSLDAGCESALMTQPPEAQLQIMRSFAPKEGTRDVRSLFMGFLSSIVNGPSAKRQRLA